MIDDLDYFVVDPGATVHIFYAANPGNGEEAQVETLGGTINGVYKRSAAIRIMDCEGVCTSYGCGCCRRERREPRLSYLNTKD